MFKIYCSAIVITAILIATMSPAVKAEDKYMAYSATYAEANGLPKEAVVDMPESLHFIEMQIDKAKDKPVCHLNIALDNDPDFAFPKKDYHGDKNKIPNITTENPEAPFIEIGTVKYGERWERNDFIRIETLIHDDKFVHIEGQMHNCGPFTIRLPEEKGALQIQKANAKGLPEDVRFNPRNPETFFKVVYLPEIWIKKVQVTLKNAVNS